MDEVLLDYVQVPRKGGFVAVITLNRPRAKNALNKQLCVSLVQKLENVRSRADVCCVIITGAGGCFSAGVDLKEPMFADPAMMNEEALDSPRSYLWQLQHVTVPIIAAVAGPCITGGMEVALNCDIILAAPSAIFRDTHSTFGIVPGGGMTQLLPRYIGLQAAKWMSLTGQPVNAHKALALGLVSEVVSHDDKLLDRAIQVAQLIATKSKSVTATVKQMQHTGLQYSIQDALKYELKIASKHYVEMGKAGAATQENLSTQFAARSKL